MNKAFITTLLVAASVFSTPAFSTVVVFNPPGTGSGTGTTTETLSAANDAFTITLGGVAKVSGNVTTNDKGFQSVTLRSSQISKLGSLEFNSAGDYSYSVNERAPEIVALKAGQLLTDVFTYVIKSGGQSKKATLTVTILGNPANNSGGVNTPVQNVEIEFNDTSATATPLNAGQLIKGHLYASNDKDWYSIGSPGDEIIHIEVCAKGSVCFDKKSWVMYVFDGDKFTPEMEKATVRLDTYRKDGGGIVSSSDYDDLYLLYNSGVFEGALIGIIDPCFDTTNSVDIGTPNGARTYFIGISVPLKRDGEGCKDGSIVLKRDGLPVIVQDPNAYMQDPNYPFIQDPNAYTQDPTALIPNPLEPGKFIFDTSKKIPDITKKIPDPAHQIPDPTKKISVPTEQQYISAYPNSDDEYDITVTNTGKNPLAVGGAPKSAANSASAFTKGMPAFNEKSHQLTIPKLSIANKLYSATLSYQGSLLKKKAAKKIKLKVKKIAKLSKSSSGNPHQATVNENNQVLLSTVRDSKTNKFYSAELNYHPKLGKKPSWLEVISVTPW